MPHRDDYDLYKNLWHDFKEGSLQHKPKIEPDLGSEVHPVKSTKGDLEIGHSLRQVDNDAKFIESAPAPKQAKERIRRQYDYLPLTSAETETLQRCLRLSKRPLSQTPLDDDEEEVKPKKRKYTKKNTARWSASATPEILSAEDYQADNVQSALRSLITTLMPTRNFDWIMANLRYGRTLLGLEDPVKARARGRKVKYEVSSQVEKAELAPENAALALFALAQTSGLAGLQKISLSGEPTTTLSDLPPASRQREEAEGVIRSFKALFPTLFPECGAEGETDKASLVKKLVRDSHTDLLKAFLQYSVESGNPELRRLLSNAQASEGSQPVKDSTKTVVASERVSETNDWADLEYNEGPFSVLNEDAFEKLSAYEQALIAYDGKLPQDMKRKFIREERQARRQEEAAAKEERGYYLKCKAQEKELTKLKKLLDQQSKRHVKEVKSLHRKQRKLTKQEAQEVLDKEKSRARAKLEKERARRAKREAFERIAAEMKKDMIKRGLHVRRKRGRPKAKTLMERERDIETTKLLRQVLRRGKPSCKEEWNDRLRQLCEKYSSLCDPPSDSELSRCSGFSGIDLSDSSSDGSSNSSAGSALASPSKPSSAEAVPSAAITGISLAKASFAAPP
jgi:hypothetical protein